MDRFPRALPVILSLLLCLRTTSTQATATAAELVAPDGLYQTLEAAHRSIDIFHLSLTQLQNPACHQNCQIIWSRNAARSLLLIGDYDGAMTYLRYGLKIAQPEQSTFNRELLAYAALRKNDEPLWKQHRDVFPETRRIVIEGVAGANAFQTRNRRDLLPLATHSALPAEQQQQILSYAKAEQTSPWMTGAMSTVVPGSGMLLLGMGSSAVQSLFLTATSAWATTELFRRHLDGAGFAAALITSVFYVGGIQATVRSTHEINASQGSEDRQNLMDWALPAMEFEWKKSF